MQIGRSKPIVAAAAFVVSAWLALAPVEANQIFQQQTGKSCADCHLPNQEALGVKGLNAMGAAFKDCGFKFGCATPPKSAQNTTETHQGMATFSNTQCSGQTRSVTLRAGGNSQDRAILLFIEPNQKIKTGVSRGTMWAANCGIAASDNAQFHFVHLDLIVD